MKPIILGLLVGLATVSSAAAFQKTDDPASNLSSIVGVPPPGARGDDMDPQRADIRCFLGMTAMAKNETYKQWATFGIFFYTGRLKGRDPKIDMRAAIRREYPLMRPANYNDEIKRCSDELGEVSRDLESMKREVPRGAGR